MAVDFSAYVDGTASSAIATAVMDLSARSVGDYGLVMISRAAVVDPTGVPTDWTLIDSHLSTYGIWLYGKILASGDLISNLTWTWAGNAKTLATGAFYTGVDTSTPVESYSKGTYGTALDQTLDLGSVTTDEPMIVALASCYSTSTKTYDLSSQTLTERRDRGGTAPDFWHYIGDKNAAWGGGTFAPSTSTNYISASVTYRGGFLVALNASTASASLSGRGIGRGVGRGIMRAVSRGWRREESCLYLPTPSTV